MTTIAKLTAAFDRSLGGSCSATHYVLDGVDYIVTSGTGEGYDFAYLVEGLDAADFRSGWNYSEWCQDHEAESDLPVAVAYYMQTGRVLGVPGACTPALTASQREVLEIARNLSA